jgi:hypothetical protein
MGPEAMPDATLAARSRARGGNVAATGYQTLTMMKPHVYTARRETRSPRAAKASAPRIDPAPTAAHMRPRLSEDAYTSTA